ncbi:MAG: acetolactate decarboxylase [Bacteroidota bacterium]|nr:acetolactate decarboxylase [Bacteroidota bacterium]
MKSVLITLLIGTLFFPLPPAEVKVAGEMKKIMREGNLSAHIALDTLLTKPNIYGLGPAEGIKGELMIVDSKAYWCKVENEKISTTFSGNVKAAMLVYAQVPAWKLISVNNEIKDYAALEKAVEQYASQNGQNLDEPFPFLITGIASNTTYHIIDWKEGVKHTFDNHKQFAKNGELRNQQIMLLGFYSNKHHSIFTHHTTNMHVHVMDANKSVVGHLEEFSSAKNTLLLQIPN